MAVKFLNGIDVDGSMNIAASDVPNLDASKITSGTLSADRIPTGLYQPAGDYLDLETANTTFQPLGNYLTSVPSEYLTQTEGDARYLRLTGGTLSNNLVFSNDSTGIEFYSNNSLKKVYGTGMVLEVDATRTNDLVLQIKRGTDYYHMWHSGHFTSSNVSNWNTAYGWGNHASAGYLTSIPSTYATDAEVNTAVGAVDARIDNEVFPAINDLGNAIPTNNNQLTNGAGYLTAVPSSFTTTNITATGYIKGGGQQLVLSAGEAQNYATGQTAEYIYMNAEQGLEINSDTGNWAGGWAARKTAYLRGDQLTLDGETLTKTNIQNFKTAYGWGNHASAGYLTSIPSTYATDAEVNTAVGAVDTRINDEVIPYIASVETIANGKLDATAKAADADLLDGQDSGYYLDWGNATNRNVYSGRNNGSTGAWHIDESQITAYEDGLTIALFTNAISGASTTTLEVNSLGAKTIYYNDNSKLTTHYGNETLIMLYFDAVQDRWYCHDFYDTTDDYRIRWQNNITFGAYTHGYQILLEGVDGKYYPVTEGGSTANTNTVSTANLKIGGQILYYGTSTDQAANTNQGDYDLYEGIYNGEMEYWNNRDSGWATAYRAIYFVGIPQGDGTFLLDNSSYTSFLTQDLPTAEDGKIYIQVGIMNNNYDAFRLNVDHPIYEYKDGGLRLYVPRHDHANATTGTDGFMSS